MTIEKKKQLTQIGSKLLDYAVIGGLLGFATFYFIIPGIKENISEIKKEIILVNNKLDSKVDKQSYEADKSQAINELNKKLDKEIFYVWTEK